MTLTLQEVFKEDYYKGILDDIYYGELTDGVQDLHDSLEYNSGWYNYSNMYFNYKGIFCSVEFREHTSDNVCEFEILEYTFKAGKEVEDEFQKEDTVDYEAVIEEKDILIEELRKMNAQLKERYSKLETAKAEASSLEMDPKIFKLTSELILQIVSEIENSEKKDNSHIKELCENIKKILIFAEVNLSK